MINKENFKTLLVALDFELDRNVYIKHFLKGDFYLKADYNTNELIYPENKGFKVNERQTCNFVSNENFVVFECVHRLFMKEYKPEHIELEPKWKLGHGASGGRADIFIRDQQNKPLLIIECKTAGREFDKAWKDTIDDGAQLFSYIEQEKDVEFVCLYASDFDEKSNTINVEHRIISHKDNEIILTDDPKLKSFKDAKNVKERFKVWKDTYQLESTEQGIFEENIQAYQIGKNKYTLAIDTKVLDTLNIKGKYHQFRTILRKYNVSRRENAFEVLVNLFLCKIVDEIENPDELKFYWKGIAYDNYFDLVDRLQELYKIGMGKFLHQDIVYVSTKEIDDAFWAVKQKRNATKQRIKEIFRELKFYKGLDFDFIKVHNKEYFNKNAKVLLEIIQMWQGLRLKTNEQNQILGDMFEYFLDNGIKQTEGQFFTPIPICKFIVMSLPLENQLEKSNETLKVIDYACGAGHFLTEYALQIKPLVKQYKQAEPSEYYKNIYGIEKEDRLAKVAKVSAFMYGHEEINIIDSDALAAHPRIKNDNFDVLIANPPFAVEDFLMTLEDTEREKYELLDTVSDLGNKNIQCFFLERAKQLLAGNGVAGIIVPSSILSNSDTMHIATREILLKYFDFVSIVELGSGTFGKTGTNTVILFLRRKAQLPEPAVHYWNRTLDFFDNWVDEERSGGGAYLDMDVVKRYCQHIDIPFDDYRALLVANTKPLSSLTALLQYEMFKDYTNDFDRSTEVINLKDHFRKKLVDLPKTILTELRKKQKEDKTQYSEAELQRLVQTDIAGRRIKLQAEQQAELDNRFLNYLLEIEKSKLYYFMLANSNPQKVLIVKSPSDNKEQKQFLGYEWSGAKGSEGIKYNRGETIYDILTPMFDPLNRSNTNKINFLIQQNYQGLLSNIPDELQAFATTAKLEDLLDFTRKDINKAISLTPKKNFVIETKWDLVKLGEVAEIQSGGTPSSVEPKFWDGEINWATLVDTKERYLYSTQRKITGDGLKNSSAKLLPVNTVIFSSRATIGEVTIAKVETSTNQGYKNFICDESKVKHEFLYEALKYYSEDIAALAGGMTFKEVSKTELSNFRIPLPPPSVQQQIVSECETIYTSAIDAKKAIEESKRKIEELVESEFGNASEKKISEIAFINPSKTEIRKVDESTIVSFVEMASVSERGYIASKIDRPLKELKKGSYTYFADNDIIIAKITPCMENGKCALATGLTNGIGMGSSEFHVIRTKGALLSKYLFTLLNRESVRKEAEKNFTGSSGHRRVPASFYESYKIPIPSSKEQAQLVKKIEILEQKIIECEAVINGASERKQAVMKKFL